MVVEPGSFRTEFRGRPARGSRIRIPDYDEVLGHTGSGRLGPQRGDPVKAAQAILTAAAETDRLALLLLGSDTLVGYRALAIDGTIQPGRVFDRTISLNDTPDGYRAMDSREALKILIQP